MLGCLLWLLCALGVYVCATIAANAVRAGLYLEALVWAAFALVCLLGVAWPVLLFRWEREARINEMAEAVRRGTTPKGRR